MLRLLSFVSLMLATSFSFLPRDVRAGDFGSFHEDVLGTSLELVVRCSDASVAHRAEDTALAEIDRLASILSGYDPNSEFSKLEHSSPGESIVVSQELLEALTLGERWTRTSNGAFNPAVESICELWRLGQAKGQIPDSEQLKRTVAAVHQAQWSFDPLARRVHRTTNHPLTLDAFAKGLILDRVAQHVQKSVDGVDGLMINIGGDIRIVGDYEAQVEVADPRSDAIGSSTICNVTLSNQAIATSGNSERGFEIKGQKYSHIIDPRTGLPVQHIISASVIATDATTADAVATICNVMAADESLKFVEQLPGVECLLVTREGSRFASSGWPHGSVESRMLVSTPVDVDSDAKSDTNMLVEFEIAKSDGSRCYRRPYVAVWIEDEDKFPVRTLSLFLMRDTPGPRWYRDLRRWYSDDQLRLLVDSRDMIKTVSKPTRNPGEYKVSWDGLDDSGKPLADGKYTLLIEAAREHGTYQLMKHEFELGKAFEIELKGNAEISAASIEYESGSR